MPKYRIFKSDVQHIFIEENTESGTYVAIAFGTVLDVPACNEVNPKDFADELMKYDKPLSEFLTILDILQRSSCDKFEFVSAHHDECECSVCIASIFPS